MHEPELVRLCVAMAVARALCACGAESSGDGGGSDGERDVVYVDSRAPSGGNGRSWTEAFRFLADALAVAPAGSTVRVAGGSYRPDQSEASGAALGDRSATFQLRSGVRLSGGYAGLGASDPDAVDVGANQTTLSGDLAADDGPDFANRSDNSLHVVTGSGTDASAVLEGFTISGGNADGTAAYPAAEAVGGGLLNWHEGSPTIRRCSFRANWARYLGAAIANGFGSSPSIEESSFEGNLALSLPMLPGPDAPDGGGGAIANVESSSPKITQSRFKGNQAAAGGAVLNVLGAQPRIVGCTFEDNHATVANGGAVYSRKQSHPYFRDCVFRGNGAEHVGGALAFRETPADVWIIDSLFEANTASGSGGAVRAGNSASVHVVNSAFVGNTTGDSSSTFPGPAGGLDVGSDGDVAVRTSTIENCIFWGNMSGNQPRQVAAEGLFPAGLTVRHSDVQGGSAGVFVSNSTFPFIWGEGNLDADPLFVAALAHDFHLQPGSPCRGAGNPKVVPADVESDLEGNPRFSSGGSLDLGPYQHEP